MKFRSRFLEMVTCNIMKYFLKTVRFSKIQVTSKIVHRCPVVLPRPPGSPPCWRRSPWPWPPSAAPSTAAAPADVARWPGRWKQAEDAKLNNCTDLYKKKQVSNDIKLIIYV